MKNDVATAEKTEVNTKAELLAIGEAYKAMSRPTVGLKGRTIGSSEFSAGDLIFCIRGRSLCEMERVVKLCDFDWSTDGVADDLLGGLVVEWAAAGVGEDGQGGGGWTDKGRGVAGEGGRESDRGAVSHQSRHGGDGVFPGGRADLRCQRVWFQRHVEGALVVTASAADQRHLLLDSAFLSVAQRKRQGAPVSVLHSQVQQGTEGTREACKFWVQGHGTKVVGVTGYGVELGCVGEVKV